MKRQMEQWVVLAAILIIAGTLRWVGINWDAYSHSHPDELFMATIASNVGDRSRLLDEVRDRCLFSIHGYSYFNTRCSPYNPNNVVPGSYAYGTLPVYMVHGAAWVYSKLTGDPIWLRFDGIHLVGRFVNSIADLIAVVLVFLIGRRLWGSRSGLLASALYAGAVLPIQLSHFWTVDIIANMWFLVVLYAAVAMAQQGRAWTYVLFGIALGAATASRINVIVASVLAPLATLLYLHPAFRTYPVRQNWRFWLRIAGRAVLLLVVAAALSFAVFRVAQPYAFKGPNWWNVKLNPKWLKDVREVSNLSAKRSDGWPPSHQFVGRITYLYPWWNMMAWGMGLALGLAATLAVIQAVSLQVRRRRLSTEVGLFTVWLVIYFGWMGRMHFSTMRYYLPLYAVLCLMTVWWFSRLRPDWRRVARGVVLIGTLAWAFAFTAIYRSPQTRAEAVIWIDEQLPSVLTGIDQQGHQLLLSPAEEPRLRMMTYFKPESSGDMTVYDSETLKVEPETNLTLRLLWLRWIEPTPLAISLQLYQLDEDEVEIEKLFDYNIASSSPYELRIEFDPEDQITLEPGLYRWKMALSQYGSYDTIHVIAAAEALTETDEWVLSPIQLRGPYGSSFVRYTHIDQQYPGRFILNDRDATLNQIFMPHVLGPTGDLTVTVEDQEYTARFVQSNGSTNLVGEGRQYTFDRPVLLPANTEMAIRSQDPIWIAGTTIATDGDWDFSTPTRICLPNYKVQLGYIPFDKCNSLSGFDVGWYVEVPLQIVEHDRPEKPRYMQDTLLKADYLTISSNRMYDALPRNKAMYWFTGDFYKDLFDGHLGYKEVARFDSFPRLGPLPLPDQVLPDWHLPGWVNELESEEAFSVYDHPTIYVFQNQSFTPQKMTVYTPWVDPSNRIDLADAAKTTYVGPSTAPSETRIWVEVAIWAAGFLALGWLAFPLMFVLFPALPLRGYSFGRGVIWLLMALVPWWLTAQFGLRLWTRFALIVWVILLVAASVLLYRRQGPALRAFVRAHWRAMVAMDLLWLAAFGFGIVLRGVDPDYWHPWLGGEKHMDLAYLNAVWRTGQFPPPNPWLSGFSINYYYFGFVIVAMPLKVFNIAPEIAANLALATLYGTIFVQVFSLGLSLFHRVRPRWQITFAALGTLFVMVAGNWGALYLLIQKIPGMAAHRWYWYPTRIIAESANGGGGMINEVPLFSFLYGDLHAHSIGLLPVTILLMLLWVFIQRRNWWLAPLIGALVGVIYMTNSWDILVYIPLVVLLMLALGRSDRRRGMLLALVGLGGWITLWPYLQHSTLGHYGVLSLWKGPRSLLGPFLLVWGGPLGVLAIWIMHRIKVWLVPHADMPVEIGALIVLILPAVAVGGQNGTSVLLGMLLLAALILAWGDTAARPLHLAAAFFLAGLLAVEHVVLVGDVDRMNTTFKVQFQMWLWIGLLMPLLVYRMLAERRAYFQSLLCGLLLLPGLLYPIKSIPARKEDTYAGHFTLNGYAFMDTMPFSTESATMRLNEDAVLIDYMRSHIQGYPVIAEGYDREYYWNNRISSYTGLPSVIGWRNHLHQQYPNQTVEIDRRFQDMQRFYLTSSPYEVLSLINQYHIEYIVSGQFERVMFGDTQIQTFEKMAEAGQLTLVFETGSTRLYRVVTPGSPG